MFLHGKRIKVRIHGTMPDLEICDWHGWEYGWHENAIGVWSGMEDSCSKVTFGVNVIWLVSDHYLCPMRPEMKGQNVVALSGDNIGKEFKIVKFGPSECVVQSRSGKGKKVPQISLSTDILAVVL